MRITERKTIYTLAISRRVETPGNPKAAAGQEPEQERKPRLLTPAKVFGLLVLLAIFGIGVILNMVGRT